MEKGIERFLVYLKENKKYSENTISAYRSDLTQLSHYLASREVSDWRRLTKPDIVGFWTDMRVNRRHQASTIARKLASVRSFCHYLVSAGVLPQDPSDGLDSPQVARRTPRTLSDHEVTHLIELPGRNPKPKGLRDRAILELLYATGMRVSELTAMDLDDVDMRAGSVRCGSRPATQRVVTLPGSAREALADYLELGRGEMVQAEAEKALFVNHRGERLSRQGLWLVIKDYASQLGLKGNITPHTLRHSAAASKLRRGANLAEVQHLLGHASPTSTQVYARIARAIQDRDAELR
ncbi:MAG: tyrosine-type recombinase/integrase [Anaerolineae bacterium]|nr:tyrosine-type recombinase/integrase [Anaerolineae bacterium]